MSKKFISQIINQNFIYPNNEVSEYDQEIVQDINDNSVSGIVQNFETTSVASSGITITMDYEWFLNNAEPFIRNSNDLSLVSVHMLASGQDYYKPWRCVYNRTTTFIYTTTSIETVEFLIEPYHLGLTSFQSGTYYFDVRFIGHRSVYPVCLSLNITVPAGPTSTPTSTPTVTPTPSGPTATPTPTVTPTPTPASYSIARVGACNPSQIETTYSITGHTGDTVVLRADFGGAFNASSAGSSATVTIGGTNTQSTSCFYSGTQYFSLSPTYTFTMPSTTTTFQTSAVTYEADETMTSLNVVIVSVNGVSNGATVSGCRGDSTGGPC